MRILVTGAGRAIGAATCISLTRAGHEVVATARDVSLLADLDVEMRLQLDVTDQRSILAALEVAGDLDGVVNNAALGGSAPLENFPIDRLRAMLDTNALGPLRLVQELIPGWRDRGSGVIVNVSSVQGPLSGAYAASKFAMEALSEALHYELGHFGIRVVLVEPGFIAPGMKEADPLPRSDVYEELYAQWEGADSIVTGDAGRPGPEIVGDAIVKAFEEPDTPFRVPIGDDAKMILGARSQLDDASFEAAMRSVLGLTW
jgi:NAD(P)-dependent dehydrogenase (short-subunit alcohol dehydrogenase family)